jgi:SpoVK/Ycf46/Vps4 family AAA+-type ATPase
VRGKGRGLIILLHGPPGSGKTSTAETLAAYTQRPLYSITCGDLGTNPSDVERNLVIHTTRAHKWDCLLLLDEADVFVSRRDWRDTERNALVSGSSLLAYIRSIRCIFLLQHELTTRPGPSFPPPTRVLLGNLVSHHQPHRCD